MQIISELEKKGWIYRFTANEPRLSETVAFYKEIGYDVHLEPLPEREKRDWDCELGESEYCRICFVGEKERYRMVFTRPAPIQGGGKADLF